MVTGLPDTGADGLQMGDVLLREAQTEMNIDGIESLDAVLAVLVSQDKPQAQLTVLRNGAETAAVMQLAQE